jgi:hypothetical protein
VGPKFGITLSPSGANLEYQTHDGLIDIALPAFKPGERLRVVDGLFADLQGFFRSVSNRPNRVFITLVSGTTGLSAVVEIEKECLSKVS